jgi:eukaryotic-like serine/threonine-protein kinase
MKSCPNCQNSYPTEFVVCPQDGTALIELGSWSDGSVVRGKYRILTKIGQGGMGVVYKALHVAFDELRALKVMHPSLMTDESFVKRFRHEAVITRRLQHPNAVRVDDIDEAEDGRPFIVMEYIEGRSLKSIIYEEGAMPVPRVCSISKQVAAALEAAHQLGMIHRDIKPENIVLLGLAPHEQAKVLDFGIAKIKEARFKEGAGHTLTGVGVVVGTPQYMSPEQAMGKRGDELDGRSDLYSLGVVMYQMLSGELPFRADTTMEMLIAHMQKPPMPLGQAHPQLQIPEAMSSLVMRLLEKSPDLRPASARALVEELDHVLKAPAPLDVTRVSAPEKVYSPDAAARALRQSLDASLQSSPRHSASAVPVARQAEPSASARPHPAPAPAPPARVPPPVARPAPVAPPKSHAWILWASLVVLVIVVGAGYWFVSTQRTPVASQEQGTPASSTGAAQTQSVPAKPAGKEESAGTASSAAEAGVKSQVPSRQNQPPASGQTPSNPVPERATNSTETKPAALKGEPQRKTSAPAAQPVPAAPPVDMKIVKASIAMGDLFYKRGDYGSAIGEYQKGLRADPSNTTLQSKIQAAKKAQAAEQRLLH